MYSWLVFLIKKMTFVVKILLGQRSVEFRVKDIPPQSVLSPEMASVYFLRNLAVITWTHGYI